MEGRSNFIQDIKSYRNLLFATMAEQDANNVKGYFHKELLTQEYSLDMTWSSGSFTAGSIAADVVSLDSSAPLKSRGSIKQASGEITKMSIAFRKTEKELSDLLTMQRLGGSLANLASKALNTSQAAVDGVDIRNEILLLQGMSEGAVLVPQSENAQGTAIRVSFGYKPTNKVEAKAKWGEVGADELADIDAMFEKAQTNGTVIKLVVMDKEYFNKLRKSDGGKLLVADSMSQVVKSAKDLRAPKQSDLISALGENYGARFLVVDKALKEQKLDGTEKIVRPWKAGSVVAFPDENVGRLVYSTLVEEMKPAKHVDYMKHGNYTLVSWFSETNPPAEVTTAQALCLPVVDHGGDVIYLDATKGE